MKRVELDSERVKKALDLVRNSLAQQIPELHKQYRAVQIFSKW